MAMDKLGMEIAKTGFQTADSSRTGGKNSKVGSVTDDFRSLLQSKQEGTKESQNSQDKSQVSKDTKTEKPDEVSDDAKKDAVTDDAGKTEKPGEDTGKTDEMLAAYQASQGIRPEIINLAPEAEVQTEAAALVPEAAEVQPQARIQTAAEVPEEAGEQQGTPVAAEAVQVQQNVETARPKDHQEAKPVTEDMAAVQTIEAPAPATHAESSETRGETSDLGPQPKRTEKTETVKEEARTQEGDFTAEHAAAAVTAEAPKTVQVEQKEYHNEYISTVHVEEPEELPDKVTDQLLAKLAEGVKEFEIHIEPANLGKIAVKILYEGTQAHVSIICSEKRALDVLGQNAREIGNVLSKNFGGETTIIVDKQETDYLNQTRDENGHANQEEQQKQKEDGKNQDGEDAEQFLQKLRLGLAG